jgi:hypothetical protein
MQRTAVGQSRAQLTTRSFAAGHADALIRVYDDAGNLIETHEHAGDFKVCETRQNKKPPRGEA